MTPRTIRHYEHERLLKPVDTTPGGQKLYDPAAVQTIHAIQALQDIGYAIRDIRRLFRKADSPPPSDKKLTTQLRAAVTAIDADLSQRIRDLKRAQRRVNELAGKTSGCDTCPGVRCAACPSLAALRTLGLKEAADA